MVVDEGLGPTTLNKSFQSLLGAFRSLESEVSMIVSKVAESVPSGAIARLAKSAMSKGVDGASVARVWASMFGDGSDLHGRLDVVCEGFERISSEVTQLREREVLLAGGVSELRSHGVQVQEALAGLARIQGRDLSRMRASADATRSFEHLALRRDEHITRLIRDLTVQRSQLERISEKVSRLERSGEDPARDEAVNARLGEIRRRMRKLETSVDETRKLQAQGTQGALQTMELVRERLTRLEGRMAEISREARVKSGRLDALSRHVSSVEGRLSNAIGGGDTVVAVSSSIDPQAAHS